MYRAALESTPSQAAVWSTRLAFFGFLVAALGVLIARSRAIDPISGLVVLAFGWMFALAALLLAASAAVAIWRTGCAGTGLALLAVLISLVLLAPAGYFALQAVRLPLLNDVATDTADPPDFMRTSKAMAARGGQVPVLVDAATRALQRQAYPLVQPIVLDIELEEAWLVVQKAIAARGWRIADQNLPGGRIRIGHIDAIDKTAILGFSDDITIRLRPLAGQTRIDLRSASRLGRHDFGANARRISAFAAELQAQMDAR